MIPKKIRWLQKVQRGEITSYFVGERSGVPITTVTELGYEEKYDYPDYDNGEFFVLETVKGLEWTVVQLRDGYSYMLRTSIDKYEAIRLADEFREASE